MPLTPVDYDPFGAQGNTNLTPVDYDPFGGGYNAATVGNDPWSFSHAGALASGDLARGLVAAPAGIFDLGTHLPTWAVNTATGSQLPYPPSLNTAVQSQLDKVLPTPQNPKEAYQSAAMRNWMFGPAGMAAGAASQGIQNNFPQGAQNINIAGRDVGVSPNDLATAGVGMVAQGVSGIKPFAIRSAAGTDAARVGQIALDNDIPVYPSDIADPHSVSGQLAQFFNATPFSGKGSRQVGQQGAFNKAVVGALGENADELTAPVMNDADARIGGVYDEMKGKYDLSATKSFMYSLQDLKQRAQTNLVGDEETAFNKMYDRITGEVKNATSGQASGSSGVISGTQYQGLRSSIGAHMRGKNGSPELGELQSLLDSQFQSGMSPNDAAKFQTARGQYRSMLALEPAAKAAIGTGDVAPGPLLTGVNRLYPNTVYNDPNVLPQMAQVGQMLNKAWSGQSDYAKAARFTPFDTGQIALWGGTPAGMLGNRLFNSAITPMDWSSPFLAEFYRAGKGAASTQSQRQ